MMSAAPTPAEKNMSAAAYNLVIIGGTAGALSVAVSSQRSGLEQVRIVAPGPEVAFPSLVGDELLDIGYGEPVTSIDVIDTVDHVDPERVVVTTTKRRYEARAVMVAERPEVSDWVPPIPVSVTASDRVHAGLHGNDVEATVDGQDVLVVGTTDHAVEVTSRLAAAGGRVVLAAGGMDPTKLSPAAGRELRRLERERKVTVLYRSMPDSVGEVGGYPMAFFSDRRTPDLQLDEIVFAPPRRSLDPSVVGASAEAVATGRIWFEASEASEGVSADSAPAGSGEAGVGPCWSDSGQRVSPGWRIGLDIARSCFGELDLVEPAPPSVQRRRYTEVIAELRQEHYNATITRFEPTHSDLWVLRVRPDGSETSHLPGQYASLGLGFWEERIDDAHDPDIDRRWDKLIRRSYSISSRIFDANGYLADDTTGSELEFYIVLVRPSEGNVPALTPRLALKRPGDRIYLGPKVAGRYTLASVTDPTSTVVFLATGTGEAPHNAMAVELLRKGHTGPIVSAVSVRQWADLGYLDKHRRLEQRFANYHYVPLPTREPDVAKRYIQDLITADDFAATGLGVPLDATSTHVFCCGNPAMIGIPTETPAPDGDGDGSLVLPEPTGVVELLLERGFTLDRRHQPGNIHYEEYW